MKTLLALIVALSALLPAAFAADRAPAVPIDQALKMAQDYLKEKGEAGNRYITSLTLESVALRSNSQYWYARYSSPILGGDKPEVGLRIDMDGSFARVVTGGAVPGLGKQQYGARNMR